uniref:Putative tonB protein n=1 Tax=mine drainage metagenome TaxID=410659 RepID=E6PQJ8_9ZZZZ
MSTSSSNISLEIIDAVHMPPARVSWPLIVAVLILHAVALWALQFGLVPTPKLPMPSLIHVEALSVQPQSVASNNHPRTPPALAAAANTRAFPREAVKRPSPPHQAALPSQTARVVDSKPSLEPSMTDAERPVNHAEAQTTPAGAPAAANSPVTRSRTSAPTETESARRPDESVKGEAPPPPAQQSAAPPTYGASYLHNPKPDYPPLGRRLGEEGTVLLKVKVSAQGHVETLQVQQSSGYGQLDAAALSAVQQWTFIPAQAAGKPVSGWVLVPIVFSLSP